MVATSALPAGQISLLLPSYVSFSPALVCLFFSSNLFVCLKEGEGVKPMERVGVEGVGVCAEGEGEVCVSVCVWCVCSQGFDTAIQALQLPWCRPPYMAIGVKEQREWAV